MPQGSFKKAKHIPKQKEKHDKKPVALKKGSKKNITFITRELLL